MFVDKRVRSRHINLIAGDWRGTEDRMENVRMDEKEKQWCPCMVDEAVSCAEQNAELAV